LLLVSATGVRAQERAKQHRIAIVIGAGSVAPVSDTGHAFWRSFFEELRRLGDVEGQSLSQRALIHMPIHAQRARFGASTPIFLQKKANAMKSRCRSFRNRNSLLDRAARR
jgi:hypothetical protein